MKKNVIPAILLMLCYQLSFSQIEFGLKTGLHSTNLTTNGIGIITTNGEKLQLSLLESDYGVHFGLYGRLEFLGLFLEPSGIFNSTSSNYRINGNSEEGILTTLKRETFHNLDIPVMFGFELLIFNVFVGPVAHLRISSTSDLVDIEGYNERFSRATYGFQSGVGLDLWKLRLQVAYEGNLSQFGEHIYFGDTQLALDQRASRLLFSLGIKF